MTPSLCTVLLLKYDKSLRVQKSYNKELLNNSYQNISTVTNNKLTFLYFDSVFELALPS
jgi:hypothetical protein